MKKIWVSGKNGWETCDFHDSHYEDYHLQYKPLGGTCCFYQGKRVGSAILNLEIEALDSFETSVTIYKVTSYNISKDGNLKIIGM
jgi:hypothetical protein